MKRNKKKIGLEGDVIETKPFEITTLQRCFNDQVEVKLIRFNIRVRSTWKAIHISKDSIIKVVSRMLKKHKSFKLYRGASFTFSREDNVVEEKYMRMNATHLITSIDSFLKSPLFKELITAQRHRALI